MHRVVLLWLGLSVVGLAEELTVATFNIRYAASQDKGSRSWAMRKDVTLETIREMDPDVLGLQEALWSQIRDLRPGMEGYEWAGSGRDDGKLAGEFCAICWKEDRFRRLQTGTFWLSDTPYTAGSKTWGNGVTRICTWVRLVDKKSGASFYVFNTHWDHKHQGSREQSSRMVAAQIDARQSKGDPVVLLGDFNATEENPAVAYLMGGKVLLEGGDKPQHWENRLIDVFDQLHPDVEDRRTGHGWEGNRKGRRKIDHIFVSPEVIPRECAIIYTQKDGVWPSDHFPVRAVIDIPEP